MHRSLVSSTVSPASEGGQLIEVRGPTRFPVAPACALIVVELSCFWPAKPSWTWSMASCHSKLACLTHNPVNRRDCYVAHWQVHPQMLHSLCTSFPHGVWLEQSDQTKFSSNVCSKFFCLCPHCFASALATSPTCLGTRARLIVIGGLLVLRGTAEIAPQS